MKRGDVVTVAATGDYGKPRPAIVVQSDAFPENHGFSGDLPDDVSSWRTLPTFGSPSRQV